MSRDRATMRLLSDPSSSSFCDKNCMPRSGPIAPDARQAPKTEGYASTEPISLRFTPARALACAESDDELERAGNACRRGGVQGARGVRFMVVRGWVHVVLPCAYMSALWNRAQCVSHEWREGGVPWYDGVRGLHFMLMAGSHTQYTSCHAHQAMHAAIVAVALRMTCAEFIMLPDQKRMRALPPRPPFPCRSLQVHGLGHQVPSSHEKKSRICFPDTSSKPRYGSKVANMH